MLYGSGMECHPPRFHLLKDFVSSWWHYGEVNFSSWDLVEGPWSWRCMFPPISVSVLIIMKWVVLSLPCFCGNVLLYCRPENNQVNDHVFLPLNSQVWVCFTTWFRRLWNQFSGIIHKYSWDFVTEVEQIVGSRKTKVLMEMWTVNSGCGGNFQRDVRTLWDSRTFLLLSGKEPGYTTWDNGKLVWMVKMWWSRKFEHDKKASTQSTELPAQDDWLRVVLWLIHAN